jgi:hypothetical protein
MGDQDPLRGAEWRNGTRILSSADAANCRVAAARRHAGKNGAEPRTRHRAGSVSGAGDDDGALRARGPRVAAEFAGNSNCELLCVPLADRAAHSVFSRRRETVRRSTLAVVGNAHFGDGARKFLGRHAIFMDHDLARSSSLVLDRAAVCGIGVYDSCAVVAASAGNNTARKSDGLKFVSLAKTNLLEHATECRGLLRSV